MNWLDLCDIPAAIETIVEFQTEEMMKIDLEDLDAMVPWSKNFILAGSSSAAEEYVRVSVDARTEAESGIDIFKKRQARYKFIGQHIEQYHTTILGSIVNSRHGAVEYYVVFRACFADDAKPLHDMDCVLWFDIKDKPAFKDALEFFYKHHPGAVAPGKMERNMMAKTALDEHWHGVGKIGYPGARAQIKEKEELKALIEKYPPTILRSRRMDEYGHKEGVQHQICGASYEGGKAGLFYGLVGGVGFIHDSCCAEGCRDSTWGFLRVCGRMKSLMKNKTNILIALLSMALPRRHSCRRGRPTWNPWPSINQRS